MRFQHHAPVSGCKRDGTILRASNFCGRRHLIISRHATIQVKVASKSRLQMLHKEKALGQLRRGKRSREETEIRVRYASRSRDGSSRQLSKMRNETRTVETSETSNVHSDKSRAPSSGRHGTRCWGECRLVVDIVAVSTVPSFSNRITAFLYQHQSWRRSHQRQRGGKKIETMASDGRSVNSESAVAQIARS